MRKKETVDIQESVRDRQTQRRIDTTTTLHREREGNTHRIIEKGTRRTIEKLTLRVVDKKRASETQRNTMREKDVQETW